MLHCELFLFCCFYQIMQLYLSALSSIHNKKKLAESFFFLKFFSHSNTQRSETTVKADQVKDRYCKILKEKNIAKGNLRKYQI